MTQVLAAECCPVRAVTAEAWQAGRMSAAWERVVLQVAAVSFPSHSTGAEKTQHNFNNPYLF